MSDKRTWGLSEKEVEKNLFNELDKLGYINRTKDIKNIDDVRNNLKKHLERLNKDVLKGKPIDIDDFNNYIVKTIETNSIANNIKFFKDVAVINKAKNENIRISFYDNKNLENNVFEYSNEIKHEQKDTRTDVTLFLNGMPIVHIELKKTDVDIENARKQINRYIRDSFKNNIYKMAHIYCISNNGENYYYAATDSTNDYAETRLKDIFKWKNKDNKESEDIKGFAQEFFNKQTLFDLINFGFVWKESSNNFLVLRYYQYHAIKSILKHIDDTEKLNQELNSLDERNKLNGFIWHTTGSGKTLTSFKVCEILSKRKDIKKVVFVVDRLDLNDQTLKNFKEFIDDGESVISSYSSNVLTKLFNDPNKKIIITTIQKLDRYIKKYKTDKPDYNNYIFIFDECHRSQFGDMHKLIKKTYVRSRFFGFTGTPIFPQNHNNHKITDELFGQCLHKYLMYQGIADKNVLPFLIQYCSGPKKISDVDADKEFDALDKKNFFESAKYIEQLADYLHENNSNITLNNKYKALLTTSSKKEATDLYWTIRKKYPEMYIATLFTTDNNENLNDAEEWETDGGINAKQKLEEIINDFNVVYEENQSINEFKNYSLSVQEKLCSSSSKLELAIVVDMLTTGFDSEIINTVYLNKKLKGHKLIQTISRANRLSKPNKMQANIISFRTFKSDVDKALSLYNNENSLDYIVLKNSVEEIYEKINEFINSLKEQWPTVSDIKNEISENAKLDFVKLMKKIIAKFYEANSYLEFDINKINIDIDEFELYKNAFMTISRESKKHTNKATILDDIEFVFDTVIYDEINVDYILDEITKIKSKMADHNVFDMRFKELHDRIDKTFSKKKAELIKEFLEKWKTKMMENDTDWVNGDIREQFYEYETNLKKDIVEKFAEKVDIDEKVLIEYVIKTKVDNKDASNYWSNFEKALLKYKKIKIEERIEKKERIIDFIEQIQFTSVEEINNYEQKYKLN